MRRRHRNHPRDQYTVPHIARCKRCGDEQVFRRGELDPNRGRTGHLKSMYCFSCKCLTYHVQLRELVA